MEEGDIGSSLHRDFPINFSTAEQDTGLLWTDERKIYQKTVTVAGPIAGYANRTIQAHDISPDLFIDFFGYAKSAGTSGETIPIPHIGDTSAGADSLDCYVYNTSIVLIANGVSYAAFTAYITIRYVKDEEEDDPLTERFPSYSTSEQDTGMIWIDGKKIYSKTWDDLAGPTNVAAAWNHEISNLGDVVKVEGLVCGASVSARKVPGFADNNGVYRPMWVYVGATQITWATNTTDWSGSDESHITVFYTKSTDTGDSDNTLLGPRFSLDDTPTGITWTDGKPVYRKVLNLGTSPNAVGLSNYLNIWNLGTIIRIHGVSKNSTNFWATPLHINTGAYRSIRFTPGDLTMARYTSADMSAWGTEYVIVYFTKNMEGAKDSVRYIQNNKSLYVASTGSALGDGSSIAPFDSLITAFTWLKDKRIAPGTTTTIYVAAGTYANTSQLNLSHPNASNIRIYGYTTTLAERTIGAVSTGSKTFTITGRDDRLEFAADTTFKVYGSSFNNGTFTVDSVAYTGGNTVITVNEAIRDATVDGKLKGFGLIDRIITFADVDGLLFSSSLKMFDGFRIVGNGGGSAKVGVTVSNGASVNMGNNIVVSGFSGTGMYITESSGVKGGEIIVCANAGSNIIMDGGSTATFTPVGTAGAAFSRSSAGRGGYITYNASLSALYMLATENYLSNLEIFLGGFVVANSGTFNYSTTVNGIFLRDRGTFYGIGTPQSCYNAQNGIRCIHGSFCETSSLISRFNAGHGITTYGQSAHTCTGATLTDNSTGDASPAIGTEGNYNSLNY